ncbi:hypothetical protein [uncultured Aquimarina sp.]|uniref:OB-fold protein n=1 Tax=uncultured Aquimarina sp. TaxID=575652 RepID=UPI0026285736|nr:hypothetical protein [uncultured Aquimarina sp.]
MKKLQHIASILTFIIFIFIAFGSSDDDKKEKLNTSSNAEKIKNDNSLTETEKDSLLAIEKTKEIEIRKNQTISSRNLIAIYEKNEVSADNDFKNKTFYVEGRIDDIGKDFLDNIYITPKGASNNFRNVQCFIDDPTVVSKLQKGQFVTVYGKCNGLMMNVLMKDCEIVKNISDLE